MPLIHAQNDYRNRLATLGSFADTLQKRLTPVTDKDGNVDKSVSGYAEREMLPLMGIKGSKPARTVKFQAGGIGGIHVAKQSNGKWLVSLYRPSSRVSKIADKKSGEAIQAKKDSTYKYVVDAGDADLLRYLQEGDLMAGIELDQ